MSVEAVISTQVIDTTTVGRSVMTAADAEAARTAIGAGTSSFDGAYSSLSSVPSTFTPAGHTHGNITNAGAIGSAASLPVITGALGVLEAGSFGTTSGTFCQGNDARLSDARTPTGHTHTAAAITDFSEAVDDEVASLLVAGTNITITYNDAANTLTIASAGGSGLSGTGSVDNAVLRADGTGGATLQNSAFVIADNATASPNNTVNHASIQATGGTTNVSVSIVPKGTGAFCLQVPDGTTTGGNVRGANAIDLQTLRNAAAHVASGADSGLLAGGFNTASGRSAVVAGGRSSTASGQSAIVIGGEECVASGNLSAVLGGYINTASDNYAVSHGIYAVSDKPAKYSHSCWRFAANGDQQFARYVGYKKTTNNTPTLMAFGVGAANADAYITLASGRVLTGILVVQGSKSDGTAICRYTRQVTVANVGGTTSLVGSAEVIGADVAAGTSLSVTANNTTDALDVSVTGITAETWRWTAFFACEEMTYGA